MEIISNYNICSQKNTSFGTKKYPYENVMAIMSDSYLRGKHDSVEKTVAGILNKQVATDPAEKYLDAVAVRRMLWEQRPELMPFADSFRKALDDICINHFRITIDDVQLVSERESQKYGSKFIDIN